MPFPKSTNPNKKGRPPKQPMFYAVTFESHINAPITITGQVLASNPARSVYLSVKEARSRAKGIQWRSMVVLIDKDGKVGPDDGSAVTSAPPQEKPE